jgi:NAD(P)-dependent dehydrogenase (short-subunit alcohol dehydrogenase family)
MSEAATAPGGSDRPFRGTPFDLTDRVAVITGGGGLLGLQHGLALARAGATVALLDLSADRAKANAERIRTAAGDAIGVGVDITRQEALAVVRDALLARYGRVDVLINNAANNPKVEAGGTVNFSRLENFPVAIWDADVAVGLTGAFLCSQVFGTEMAARGKGAILNIASDLALIGPDQRIYREPGLPADAQPAKPVTYSVVKAGLVGLTRYLATYWAERGVRANALSPGGVYNGQPDDFVVRLTNLIPLGRMAHVDEYQSAVLFLCSDASSYMTGGNLVVDGGRTAW